MDTKWKRRLDRHRADESPEWFVLTTVSDSFILSSELGHIQQGFADVVVATMQAIDGAAWLSAAGLKYLWLAFRPHTDHETPAPHPYIDWESPVFAGAAARLPRLTEPQVEVVDRTSLFVTVSLDVPPLLDLQAEALSSALYARVIDALRSAPVVSRLGYPPFRER